MIILLTLITGVDLSSVPLVPSLLYDVGKLLGRVNKLLQVSKILFLKDADSSESFFVVYQLT